MPYDRLEATVHIKGIGSGQPTGMEVALDGTARELAPDTAKRSALAALYETQRQLPARPAAASEGGFSSCRKFSAD